MTIKSRNRFNLIFICIAIVVAVMQTALFIYQIISKTFTVPEVYNPDPSATFLLKFNPIYVLIGIFLLNLYVIASAIYIHIQFEKTQSTEVIYFLIFLIACLCDTTRILLPLFQVANSYSRVLMHVAYLPLFARILAPLSFLGIAVLSTEEARHNVNRNTAFIIIASLFFAKLIPFNTAIILPNFCVSYGYTSTVRYVSFFICLASISTIAISNKKGNSSQKTTIGFALICIGYSALFYCYNLFNLVIGVFCLGYGSFLYLHELHNLCLWSDDNQKQDK